MEGTTEAQPKRFQHQEILETLTVPCPPENCEERETVAYRWVFETMDDPIEPASTYHKLKK